MTSHDFAQREYDLRIKGYANLARQVRNLAYVVFEKESYVVTYERVAQAIYQKNQLVKQRRSR